MRNVLRLAPGIILTIASSQSGITFKTDSQGRETVLVLHQNGQDALGKPIE